MAILTLDASVAIKWIVEEPGSEAADMLLCGGTGDEAIATGDLIAPAFIVMEVHYALAKRFNLKQISREQLLEGPSLARDQLRLVPVEDELLAASERIANSGAFASDGAPFVPFSIYDSLYVALAAKRQCGLATADRRQADMARRFGVAVQFISP